MTRLQHPRSVVAKRGGVSYWTGLASIITMLANTPADPDRFQSEPGFMLPKPVIFVFVQPGPAVQVNDRVIVDGVEVYYVRNIFADYQKTLQVEAWTLNPAYNLLVDVVNHNLSDDTTTTLTANLPGIIIQAESIQRGAGETVEKDPVDAYLYSAPNANLARGIEIHIISQNGITINNGLRYTILNVDDINNMNIQYRSSLSDLR